MKVLNKDFIYWGLAYLTNNKVDSKNPEYRLTVSSNMLERNWFIYFN